VEDFFAKRYDPLNYLVFTEENKMAHVNHNTRC